MTAKSAQALGVGVAKHPALQTLQLDHCSGQAKVDTFVKRNTFCFSNCTGLT